MPSSFFALILLVPAQGRDAVSSTSAQPPVPFRAARFREHVAYLASDALGGRDVGSQGSAKSAEYIVRQLNQYGAKGLAPNGGWLQPFPYGKGKGQNILGIVPGKGELAKEA